MIKPRRVVEKQQKTKRIIWIVVSSILTVIFISVSLQKLNFFESVVGAPLISPIPQVLGVKETLKSIFVNPKEELVSDLQKAGVGFDDIYTASESAYIVKQKDGGEVYFTSNKDIKLQVATLQLILSQLTIEGKSFARLDLRYDKPVIVFK